jgi:shikimate kinase
MAHLWLIGMMGSGKTDVGRRVAGRIGLRFVDTDEVIAARLGCSIGRLWGTRGEEAFRDMEAAVVASLADSTDPAVIATGGGAILSDDNIAAMRGSGIVVWLEGDPEVLAARVGDGEGRPVLGADASAAALADLLESRRSRYAATATRRVPTDDMTAEAVAGEVVRLWNAI